MHGKALVRPDLGVGRGRGAGGYAWKGSFMWGVERAEHRSPRGDSAAGHLGEKSSHKVFVGLEEGLSSKTLQSA